MSLNDPQWGKRGGGNEGPPDLDEMWRSFNRKLNGLFSRRGGGGPTRRAAEHASARWRAGLICLVVLVAWLASGFYIVVEGQRGVVLTFGKFSEVTGSGLRWRIPYPIQSHEIVNLAGVRTIEVGYRNNVKTKVLKESLMLTDDENIVDIQMAVQYTIRDAKDFLFNNRQPEDAVLQAAETALREVVGKSKMDQVLIRVSGRRQDPADHAGDTGPLQDRNPDQQREHPERAAARAGPGSVLRRGEGEPGSRAPQERGTVVFQRRGSQGGRRRVAAAARGRRLQAAGDREFGR